MNAVDAVDIRRLYNERQAAKKRAEHGVERAQAALEAACRDLEAVQRTAELLQVDLVEHAASENVAVTDHVQTSVVHVVAKQVAVAASAPALAIQVLREASGPLHVDEILRRLDKKGHKIKKMTLVSAFARMAKTHDTIVRTKRPNTFRLVIGGVPQNSGKSNGADNLGQNEIAGPMTKFLNANPSRDFNAEDIAKAIGAANVSSVRAALQRLTSVKRIRRTGWGKYQGITSEVRQ